MLCHPGVGASVGLGLIVGLRGSVSASSISSVIAGIALMFSAHVRSRRGGRRLATVVMEWATIHAGRGRLLGALRAGMRIE